MAINVLECSLSQGFTFSSSSSFKEIWTELITIFSIIGNDLWHLKIDWYSISQYVMISKDFKLHYLITSNYKIMFKLICNIGVGGNRSTVGVICLMLESLCQLKPQIQELCPMCQASGTWGLVHYFKYYIKQSFSNYFLSTCLFDKFYFFFIWCKNVLQVLYITFWTIIYSHIII